jgi:transcription elongation GreA/GreB family factor
MSRDQRVQDNWALLYARELASEKKLPLTVVFCLVPTFLEATIRHYGFMLKGLQEVEMELRSLRVPFALLQGLPAQTLPAFAKEHRAAAIVTDFSPMRVPIAWKRDVAAAISKSLEKRTILARLDAELEVLLRGARASFAAATDPDSKAENKYDTRGLEAGYLARGQSQQAAEVMQAIQRYETLPLRAFTAKEPVDVGALVELERGGERTLYFIGPLAGGVEVESDGRSVLVITPQSPMGRQLAGQKQGAQFKIQIGKTSETCRITGVS